LTPPLTNGFFLRVNAFFAFWHCMSDVGSKPPPDLRLSSRWFPHFPPSCWSFGRGGGGGVGGVAGGVVGGVQWGWGRFPDPFLDPIRTRFPPNQTPDLHSPGPRPVLVVSLIRLLLGSRPDHSIFPSWRSLVLGPPPSDFLWEFYLLHSHANMLFH